MLSSAISYLNEKTTNRFSVAINLTSDDFKNSKTYNDRLKESQLVREKNPDRIPVICERSKNSIAPNISKTKYLVPADLTPSQFLFIVRKRLSLPSEKGLFLFINGIIPQSTMTFKDLDELYRDNDGFLYVSYAEENVFG